MNFSKPIFVLFFSILLCGSAPWAIAQKSSADTILSNGLRIGFDLGRVANYFIRNQKNFSLEGSVDVGYQRWLGVAEVGYGHITNGRTDLQGQRIYGYSSNGVYTRLGVERNLLRGGDDVVFYGLRYGVGRVGYTYGEFTVKDTIWGNHTASLPQTNGLLHWAELVGGLKGKVWNNFYMGFTLRFRFRVASNFSTETGPISMPGFGNATKSTQFGFSYYVFYRIPFKKPATFVRQKKKNPDSQD